MRARTKKRLVLALGLLLTPVIGVHLVLTGLTKRIDEQNSSAV